MPKHLSDRELLSLADGESSKLQAQQAVAHLVLCDRCRQRKSELASASSRFANLHRIDASISTFRKTKARASLEAHMTQASRPVSTTWYRSVPAVAAAILCIALVAFWHRTQTVSSSHQRISLAPSVPDIDLTPGDVRPVRLEDVCEAGSDDLDPIVPASVQQAVFRKYGMESAAAVNYQIDYLVSPQLGGTDSIQNLWPEPYDSTVWNARAKDALEQRLQQMVCTGKIDLASAQREIRVDWIAAYKKHFNTSTPL